MTGGYEAQIAGDRGDAQKTGSLYGLAKITEHLVKHDDWFTLEVIAQGNHIQIFVNGKKTVDFKDPNNTYTKGHFALQGHDPGSVMTFRKVEYKPLKK